MVGIEQTGFMMVKCKGGKKSFGLSERQQATQISSIKS